MSPQGRPKGEYRSAQPEGTPVRRSAAPVPRSVQRSKRNDVQPVNA